MKLQEIQNIGLDVYHDCDNVFRLIQNVKNSAEQVSADFSLIQLLGKINGVRLTLYRLGFRKDYKIILDFVKDHFFANHPSNLERATFNAMIFSLIPKN